MKKLFVFELRKIIGHWFILPITLLLLGINVFNIVQNHSMYSVATSEGQTNRMRWEYHKRLDGPLTSENVNWLLRFNEQLSRSLQNGTPPEELLTDSVTIDYNLSNEFVEEIRRIHGYEAQSKNLLKQNEELTEILKRCKNPFLLRTAQKIQKNYDERSITMFYDYSAFETYFNYTLSSFLIVLCVLFVCSSVFAGEHEKKMSAVLLGSINGRTKTHIAKILAALTAVFSVCLVFCLSDLISFLFCCRLRGWEAPIFALQSFANTPLNLSIAGTTLLCFFIKVLGFFFLALLILLFSSLIKKSFIVFILGFITVFGFMFVSAYTGGIMDYINAFNPITLMINSEMLYRFDILHFADFPIDRFCFTLITSALLSVVLVFVIIMRGNKNLYGVKKNEAVI